MCPAVQIIADSSHSLQCWQGVRRATAGCSSLVVAESAREVTYIVTVGGVGWHREAEERFGHAVLQTHLGELYSLGLYSPDSSDVHFFIPVSRPFSIACRGYYMPPEQPAPAVVEITADDAVFNAIDESLRAAHFYGEGDWQANTSYSGTFEFPDFTSYRGRYEAPGLRPELPISQLFAQVSAPLDLPEGRAWTGQLASERGWAIGQCKFLLEQYGTIEPVTLLLAVLFVSVFSHRNAVQEPENCYRMALRACGDAGNIKSLNMTNGITGITLRMDRGCQYECFERRDAEAPPDPD